MKCPNCLGHTILSAMLAALWLLTTWMLFHGRQASEARMDAFQKRLKELHVVLYDDLDTTRTETYDLPAEE